MRPVGGWSKVVTLPPDYGKLVRAGDMVLLAYTADGLCLIAPKFYQNKIAEKLQELQQLLKVEKKSG